MSVKIITNNVPRPLIRGYELPAIARPDFDYIDFDYIDADEFDYHNFVLYKGNYYNVSDFMRIEEKDSFNCVTEFQNWHGYIGESYFSGILIKIVDEEHVIMGRFY